MDSSGTILTLTLTLSLTLIHRYDMDSSGTINTAQELQMLTTNCIFKLGELHPDKNLTLSANQVAAKIKDVGELSDENAWSPADYIRWFDEEVLRI